MIELHSITVENFRAFTYARFEPSVDGMTAISGGNGAGKSSIIHALLWALYGIAPAGVAVGGLRREGTVDPVVVKVEFRHNEQTVVVTRSMRGKSNTAAASILVDGVEQTAVSARTATAWVENRLNLDSEGFLTAVVVRQKELDDLVRARPAERRKVVERLAGIERMSAAVTRAREQARESARVLNALPAPEMTVTEAETAAQEAKTAHTEAITAAENAETAAKKAAEEEERATSAETAGNAAFAALNEAQQKVNVTETKLDAAAEALTTLEKQAVGADDEEAARHALRDSEKALTEAQRLGDNVKHARKEVERVQGVVQNAKNALARAQTAETTARQRATTAQEKADSFDSVSDNLTAARSTLQNALTQQGTEKVNVEKINASIAALTHTHDPECPTCQQPVHDPSALLVELNKKAEDATAAAQQADADVRDADQKVKQWEERDKEAETARIAAASAASSAESAAQAVKTAEEAVQEAQTALDDAQTEETAADTAAQVARDNWKELNENVDRDRRRLGRAEQATAAAANLETARSRVNEATIAHTEATTAAKTANQACQNIDLNHLKEQAAAARTANTTAATTAAAAIGEKTLTEERAKTAATTAARVQSAIAAQEAARIDAERATRVASGLNDFRQDRLARLAPELSEVASDFVATMSGNQLASVQFDEDFTPVVYTHDGQERLAAQLSGGEESLVALALRISIGTLIAGHGHGLLVLDEVLTALDETRRTATVAAIRELPRQVVTINHVFEALDMVDYVVAVESHPDDEALGSTLTVEGATTSIASADLTDSFTLADQ
jgi:exonuclease SbcC